MSEVKFVNYEITHVIFEEHHSIVKYIPYLAVSGCDIAVRTHWECSSSILHPCPSPTPSSPWCLHRSVMNKSDLMTHVTIALTPTYSNVLPLSVNGLGVETADTMCRCRDRFVLFKLDMFCVVVCMFIVKVCLSQTLFTLFYTHVQLHMCTLNLFTQLCIFFSIGVHLMCIVRFSICY